MTPTTQARLTLPDALRWQLRALRQRRRAGSRPVAVDRRAHRRDAADRAPRRSASRWRPLAPLAAAAHARAGPRHRLAGGPGARRRRARRPTMRSRPHHRPRSRSDDPRIPGRAAGDRRLHAAAGAAAPPNCKVLDRSAAQIRTALARDPDARFLLDRLQRTYTRRLALTQRLALHLTLASSNRAHSTSQA